MSKTIQITGKFFDNQSLTIINRYLAIELSKHFNVILAPLDIYNPETKIEKPILNILRTLIKNKSEDVDIEIRHSYPPLWRWPSNKKTKLLYIQPWEYIKVPSEWQYKFEMFADGLIVPSKWNATAYLNAGIDPEKIHVVPNGYNPLVFNTNNREKTKIFTYTFVGNSQFRKGIDILLNSWKETFKKADNVQLIIKDSPLIYGATNVLDEIIKMQHKTGCAKIQYIDDNYSEIQMADLYRKTDIIVHPYRAEGFGMHIQEAAACGAMPLVTANGPTDEFAVGHKINSTRQIINMTDNSVFAGKPGDSYTLMGEHAWIVQPDGRDLMDKMKLFYYHHDRDSVIKTEPTKNTWESVGNEMKEILESLHNGKPQRFRR